MMRPGLGPGRPRGPETVEVRVRITPEQRHWLWVQSQDKGVTMSTVLRGVLETAQAARGGTNGEAVE